MFEYDAGNIDSTTGLLVSILLNLLPFLFGSNFYDFSVKEIFWFLPDFVTRDLLMRDLAMMFMVYVGILYSIFLLYFLFNSVKTFKTRLVWSLQVIQHFVWYIILYNFDCKIEFVRNNIGWIYISVLFIYWIVLTKLIIWVMAKMTYINNIIKLLKSLFFINTIHKYIVFII